MLYIRNLTEKSFTDFLKKFIVSGIIKDDKLYCPVMVEIVRFNIPEWYPKKIIDSYLSDNYRTDGHPYTYQERIDKNINFLIKQLKNGNFRRAFIPIFYPDDIRNNPDKLPCLTSLFISYENCKYYLNAVFRSQDLLLGFPANVLLLLKYKEIISKETGEDIYKLRVISPNMHIYYRRDKDLLKLILSEEFEHYWNVWIKPLEYRQI